MVSFTFLVQYDCWTHPLLSTPDSTDPPPYWFSLLVAGQDCCFNPQSMLFGYSNPSALRYFQPDFSKRGYKVIEGYLSEETPDTDGKDSHHEDEVEDEEEDEEEEDEEEEKAEEDKEEENEEEKDEEEDDKEEEACNQHQAFIYKDLREDMVMARPKQFQKMAIDFVRAGCYKPGNSSAPSASVTALFVFHCLLKRIHRNATPSLLRNRAEELRKLYNLHKKCLEIEQEQQQREKVESLATERLVSPSHSFIVILCNN